LNFLEADFNNNRWHFHPEKTKIMYFYFFDVYYHSMRVFLSTYIWNWRSLTRLSKSWFYDAYTHFTQIARNTLQVKNGALEHSKHDASVAAYLCSRVVRKIFIRLDSRFEKCLFVNTTIFMMVMLNNVRIVLDRK